MDFVLECLLKMQMNINLQELKSALLPVHWVTWEKAFVESVIQVIAVLCYLSFFLDTAAAAAAAAFVASVVLSVISAGHLLHAISQKWQLRVLVKGLVQPLCFTSHIVHITEASAGFCQHC